jgi:hypothetical protein
MTTSAQPLPGRRFSRRFSTLSGLEQGGDGSGTGRAAGAGGSATRAAASGNADANNPTTITEEINEIKRYEDFTTIDWVQDAVQAQARRRAKRVDGSSFWYREGTLGWRRKVRESYDAGQAWLVVILVGAAIGLNSAFLNIVTEWLADVKLGYCTSAFYLNEQFCCWGAEEGMLWIFFTYLSLKSGWFADSMCYQVAINGSIGALYGCLTMLHTSCFP